MTAILDQLRDELVAQAEEESRLVSRLNALLREYELALEAVRRNDLTERYEYHGRRALNSEQRMPDPGQRWLTPREIADRALKLALRPDLVAKPYDQLPAFADRPEPPS